MAGGFQIASDGRVFSYGSSFFTVKTPEESPLKKREFSDPIQAPQAASGALQLPIEVDGASAEATGGIEVYSLKGTYGASADPQARLTYLVKTDRTLALVWRVETDIADNWLLTYVDAETNGEIHGVVDYVADFATYKV